ncbi:MAG: hypothetical protein ACT4QD_15245 [Acidobacteriota bacterium]
MVRKLIEHLLLWLAASAIIVLGVSWAYTFGFTSYRPHLQLIGLVAATLATTLAAALVQRAPLAVLALVVLSGGSCGVGIWLMLGGAVSTGAGYLVLGLIYVAALGPSCARWLASRSAGP